MSNNLLSLSPFMNSKFAQSPFLAKQGSISNVQYSADNIFNNEMLWSSMKGDFQGNQQRCSPRRTPILVQNFKSPFGKSGMQMSLRQTPRRSQDKQGEFHQNDNMYNLVESFMKSQQQHSSDGFRSKKLLNFGGLSSRDHSIENINPNLQSTLTLSNLKSHKDSISPMPHNGLISPVNVRRSSSKRTPQNQLVNLQNQISSLSNQNNIQGFASKQIGYQHQLSPRIKPFSTGVQAGMSLYNQAPTHKLFSRKQDSTTAPNSELMNEDEVCLISPIHFQKMRSIKGNNQNNISISGFQLEKITGMPNFSRQSSHLNKVDDFAMNQSSKDIFPLISSAYQNFQYDSPAPKQSHYATDFDTPSFNQNSTCYDSIYNQSCNRNTAKSVSNLLRLKQCQTTSQKQKNKKKNKASISQEQIQNLSPEFSATKKPQNKKRRQVKTEQKQQSLLDKLTCKEASPVSFSQKQAKNLRTKGIKLAEDLNKNNSQQSTQATSVGVNIPQKQITHNHHSHHNEQKLGNSPQQPGVSTKKCTCSKSKCLKLYCECFAAGLVCGLDCGCKDCCNTEDSSDAIQKAKDEIMKRDPLAFEIKVSQNSGTDKLQHRKGCTCKKSGCQKGYCECFQLGVPCTDFCKCSGCANCEKKSDQPCLQTSLESKPVIEASKELPKKESTSNIIFQAQQVVQPTNQSQNKSNNSSVTKVADIMTRSARKRLNNSQ